MNLVRQQRAPKQQQQAQQHVNNISTSTKASDQETPVQSDDNSGDGHNVDNNVNNDDNVVANDDVDRGDEHTSDNHESDNHESSWEKATRAFFQSTEDPPSMRIDVSSYRLRICATAPNNMLFQCLAKTLKSPCSNFM